MPRYLSETGLSPMETAFVAEYLAGMPTNGTAAAIAAGYAPKGAKRQAHELLQRPRVKAAIDAARADRADRLKTKADDVVLEMKRMAMFDPAELINVKRPADIAKLPPDVRRAIVGWSWDRKGRFVVKLVKADALDMLARHFGVYNDKLKVEITSTADRLKRAEARRKAKG